MKFRTIYRLQLQETKTTIFDDTTHLMPPIQRILTNIAITLKTRHYYCIK